VVGGGEVHGVQFGGDEGGDGGGELGGGGGLYVWGWLARI
jgi:hypothetical protein